MRAVKAHHALRFAALPWRISEGGLREVMLLTTRETRRWVIPKGWPMKGRRPVEVASQEAYEEAGLIGQTVGNRPLGSFHYEKRLAKKAILCEVQVFLFRVERQIDDWPERGQGECRWFDANEAATMVEEGGLVEMLKGFAGSQSDLCRSVVGVPDMPGSPGRLPFAPPSHDDPHRHTHDSYKRPQPAPWAIELDTMLYAALPTWMAASNRAVTCDVLGVSW
jgi:8-oxo-dGTP pyrophosphatase MutT (NUDIX family)